MNFLFMIIVKNNFSGILPDNDVQYISYIKNVINSVDKEAELTIIESLNGYRFLVIPSDSDKKGPLVTSIEIAHNVLNLKVMFQKTIRFSKSIYFELS